MDIPIASLRIERDAQGKATHACVIVDERPAFKVMIDELRRAAADTAGPGDSSAKWLGGWQD